jgi:hypothetical protein
MSSLNHQLRLPRRDPPPYIPLFADPLDGAPGAVGRGRSHPVPGTPLTPRIDLRARSAAQLSARLVAMLPPFYEVSRPLLCSAPLAVTAFSNAASRAPPCDPREETARGSVGSKPKMPPARPRAPVTRKVGIARSYIRLASAVLHTPSQRGEHGAHPSQCLRLAICLRLVENPQPKLGRHLNSL